MTEGTVDLERTNQGEFLGSKPEIEQPARVMQAAGEILELCMSLVSREKASKA
jgi:hypothetical protein